MGLFKKTVNHNRNKAVVVGLDGVPFSLLHDLIQRGLTPNMKSIFDKGYFGQMGVTIPEISSISWSSFMTGTQSGEHNIFGFMDLEPGTYKLFFPNYQHLMAPTLWDDLAAKGKKSVVINMPATYPAKEINGALISGFVAVDINKAVFPIDILPQLKSLDYRIDLNTMKAREDHDFLFEDLDLTLKGRERAVDLLWDQIDWDLFVVVITGTDRLMHFLWSAYGDEKHPFHQKFLDYFSKVDTFIGKIINKFEKLNKNAEGENRFYMLSDHGFTGIKSEVYLNRWLQENGYLHFTNTQPKTIMDIGPESTAFVMDPSRVHINLKEKYPFGTVSKADYERVRKELKEGFESITFSHNGDKIINKVYLKEELFDGPFVDNAPDLVLLSNHGYDLKGIVSKNEVFGRTNLTGMHTQNDAFFYSSDGTECDSIFNAKEVIFNHVAG